MEGEVRRRKWRDRGGEEREEMRRKKGEGKSGGWDGKRKGDMKEKR